jgi:aryl-alcohol dehydrogenase-like predicted oxidoreductase
VTNVKPEKQRGEALMEQEQVATRRTLGRSGIEVSAMGLGLWAIGGAQVGDDGINYGWEGSTDKNSIEAIRRGIDCGITFFDTADTYGSGHSERLLAKALGTDRGRVVIATKFGWTFDEGEHRAHGPNTSPEYVRQACEASLRRLGTNWIDLYQLHVGEVEPAVADAIVEELERLKDDGLIRAYGWSTDNTACAGQWLGRPGYTAVQHNLNVFEDAPEMLALCERENLVSINRNPLAMGFLSGKYTKENPVPKGGVRTSGAEWMWLFDTEGVPSDEALAKLDAVREILTSDGRTLVQGAIGWIWARSGQTVPIPGVKTAAQAEENAGTMELGPLAAAQVVEIDRILRG